MEAPSFYLHPTLGYKRQTRKYQCGRKSKSPRLQKIIAISGRTISDLARIAALAPIKNPEYLIGAEITSDRKDIHRVIQGKRNTKRLVEVIEREWRLPIDEIRKIYKDDLERIEAGNPLSRDEIYEFHLEYEASLKGITKEQFKENTRLALKAAGFING